MSGNSSRNSSGALETGFPQNRRDKAPRVGMRGVGPIKPALLALTRDVQGPFSAPVAPKAIFMAEPEPWGCGGTGAALRAKSPAGKEKGKGTHSHEREVRRKEEGSRKMMWLGDNAVIWSFQITSVFYIVI